MADFQSEVTSTQSRRGRPPGSRNKPKPPVIIAPNPFPRSEVVEISPGSNIIESVVRFGERINASVTITSGSGMVSNFVLHSPESVAPLMLPGPVNLLNINGTFLHLTSSFLTVGITFAGKDGRVNGGFVRGTLTAYTHVFLAVTVFINPSNSLVTNDASVHSTNGSRQLAGISNNVGHDERIRGSSTPMHNCDEGSSSRNTLDRRFESPNIMSWASTNSLQPHQQPKY